MRRTVRDRVLAATIGGGLVVASSVAFTSPASADNGDGNLACSWGEICLAQANPADLNDLQRHFWHGGTDAGYWAHTTIGGTTRIRVQDDASSMKNRDTECDVISVNYSGSTVVGRQTFANNERWTGYTTAMNDKNDAHWRCTINGS